MYLHPVVESFSNEKVERVVAALAADWERQEGVLRRAQVDRLLLKRRLSGEEAAAVFKVLASRGIAPENNSNGSESGQSNSLKENPRWTKENFVADYFSHRLLSQREEVELGRAIQLGLLARVDIESGSDSQDLQEFIIQGEGAKIRLVESNLRLVLSEAQKIAGYGSAEISDLVQDGTFGLMRAAELFDPDLGLKFSTYATHWIRQSMFRGLDNSADIIRLPVHRLESIRKLRRAKHLLSFELGRQPGLRELAEALDWTPEFTAYIRFLSTVRLVSLDAPIDNEGDLTLGDSIECTMPNPEQLCIQSELRSLVHELLNSLDPRQQMVLARRFGLGNGREETLQQIGDYLNLTRERVRQIETKALEHLLRRAKSVNAVQLL